MIQRTYVSILTTSTIVTLLALLVGCEPDEDRCDPSLCHPPEVVVGVWPNCECKDLSKEEEVEVASMQATATLTLPPGWELEDVQLSPESAALSTKSPGGGCVGMRVLWADFEETALGQLSVSGLLMAPASAIEGNDAIAFVHWDGPLKIRAIGPNGQMFQNTLDIERSAIALTSMPIFGGVTFEGSIDFGIATLTLTGAALYKP